jgi:hypothetical protein
MEQLSDGELMKIALGGRTADAAPRLAGAAFAITTERNSATTASATRGSMAARAGGVLAIIIRF